MPIFDPPLSPAEAERFSKTSDLIWSLSQNPEPYLVLFMGAYKRAPSTFEVSAPPDGYFDR